MLDSLPTAGPTRPLPIAILTNSSAKIQRLTKIISTAGFPPRFPRQCRLGKGLLAADETVALEFQL
jgi:hypothetical protein